MTTEQAPLRVQPGPLLSRIDERVAREKEEGDHAYCHGLGLKLEYLTKLTTLASVACVQRETNRHRYRLEHGLVRANSIGDWVRILNDALTGPAADCLRYDAKPLTSALTQRVTVDDSRYDAVAKTLDAAIAVGATPERLGRKAALRQMLHLGSHFRNSGRGHGATTLDQSSQACLPLSIAISILQEKTPFFSLAWVHLHRNRSGKYRVTPLLNDSAPFHYLRTEHQHRLSNGLYIFLSEPVHVPLAFLDGDSQEIFLPNGNYRAGRSFQVLSYVSGARADQDANPWSAHPDRLPASETEGQRELGSSLGPDLLTNLPPRPQDHVARPRHEGRLREELLKTHQHPIISLTGPGGIGKTSIAIETLHSMARQEELPYQLVLWLSARDVDLLETGPRPVSPRVVRQGEIARAVVELLEEQADDPKEYFQSFLERSPLSPALVVFDNFETVESPPDVVAWIDAHIRPPNKVLITTRYRDFQGDFPLTVGGMTDNEATQLIGRHAERLGIADVLTADYRASLIRETQGHPYVMKISLGTVAREGRPRKPERIVAGTDGLLAALFERTYDSLSPAAQQLFLLLSSWRVMVPEVAVEAVVLTSLEERIDVSATFDELRRYSMIQEWREATDDESYVGVALPAALFGQRKLEVSPYKYDVEKARQRLIEFGPGRPSELKRGVAPHIQRLLRQVGRRAKDDAAFLTDRLQLLEFLAQRLPYLYGDLATLVVSVLGPEVAAERARTYLRLALEATHDPEGREDLWRRMEHLCKLAADVEGEIEALTEGALISIQGAGAMSSAAKRLHNRFRSWGSEGATPARLPGVKARLKRFASRFDREGRALDADDCSRLAWLYIHLKNTDRARDIAALGLERDPANLHCRNLLKRLNR
ncbi:MAG: hypothetical protein OXF79_21120 [Chloroflexi bacterium]|nr:hypothetical protein [Chloroflexota bacterium]